ncbi:MAG: O-antigen ligase family protein [Chloroflexota bacterium]
MTITQRFIQFYIVLTVLIAPMFLKWDNAPAPFTGWYVLGYVIVTPMIISIVLWAISGFKEWRRLIQTGWHQLWLVCLIALNVWAFISQFWAFGLDDYAGMAQTSSLQLSIVSVFSLVVMTMPDTRRWIIGVLIFSMLVLGMIGQLQVFLQSDIGLSWLGEFSLDPQESGKSVLVANGVRWLRPYGLMPHPNNLGGVITLGLFASASWILADGQKRLIGTTAFIISFWFLLLTFSRGAWLGFTCGMLFVLPLVIRREKFFQKIMPTVIGVIIVGSLFVAFYQPFLLARAGIGQENTEVRSIADRVIYNRIAWEAIREHPFQGIGMGNYPWYAANYLFYNTDYDLTGADVHHIYLGVWADLGTVGIVFFVGMLLGGIFADFRTRSLEAIALIGGFIAWAVIGFLDHYMWTLVITQTLWMTILASSMSGDSDNTISNET